MRVRKARFMTSFLLKKIHGASSDWRDTTVAEKKEIEDFQDITVSAKVLGEICGIGERMVRKYADDGVFKRSTRGKYKLLLSVKNYITTVKLVKVGEKGIKADLGAETRDLKTEQAVHEHLKTMITDIKLQLIKGQVHKSEDVERVITDMFTKFKSKMQALPAKLAPKLEQKEKAVIQDTLKFEIAEALEELSEYNPADYYGSEHIDIEDDELLAIIDEGQDE